MSSPLMPETIVLIDKTGSVPADQLAKAAAAINTQISRDVVRFWSVAAGVQAVHDGDPVPVGAWPVSIVPVLSPGEGGFHLDRHGQPYAEVATSDWTVAASHEIIEMLVDPVGNRLKPSRDLRVNNGALETWGPLTLRYLVEACDPCESRTYQIDGIAVSDFLTPHYYDPHQQPNVAYSFTGALTGPRTLLPGGYVSWLNPNTGTWWQAHWDDQSKPPELVDLGDISGVRSIRECLDARARSRRATA